MVEMERNYITAEYFRTIQVRWGGTGPAALHTQGCCVAFCDAHRACTAAWPLWFWRHCIGCCRAHPLFTSIACPTDGQDAGRQGDVHAGRAAGDGGARGQPRGEALQAHHQPGGAWGWCAGVPAQMQVRACLGAAVHTARLCLTTPRCCCRLPLTCRCRGMCARSASR